MTRKHLESSLFNEGFTSSEIEYVKKNAKIEWKYEAVKCVNILGNNTSKKEATEILKMHKFTDNEITYALNACGIN
jgi:hypothetical protein